ncbi:putative OPA3-like protein CG13603 [Copidosoma floridanum]|uniref:putative OPA3-like protein CG13603 n=1 Tax=Copidosoma floridanum TaxID=29053 RepID=UPI0006C96261|nr:putative OPA3-like protein CG13603 [Copidosoma floridanum]
MASGTFPGSALFTQMFRQLTKPLSQRIVKYAASRPFFRQKIITVGRVYDRLDTNLRRLKEPTVIATDIAAAKKPNQENPAVPSIKDEQAVEIASQLMIEVVVFLLLFLVVWCEWLRSQRKSEAKEAKHRQDFENLETLKLEAGRRLEALELETDRLRAELARLQGKSS